NRSATQISDNFGAEFLGKFALEAGHRIFAAFQPTAWQLPLVSFIQQEHDPVVLQEDTLHRHRETHPAFAFKAHSTDYSCSSCLTCCHSASSASRSLPVAHSAASVSTRRKR